MRRKRRRRRRSRRGRRSLRAGSEAGTRKTPGQTAMKSSRGGGTGEATLASRGGTHLRQRSTHTRVHEGAGGNSGQKKGNIRRREGKRTLKADKETESETERTTRGRGKRGIRRIETGTETRGVRGEGGK